MNKLICPACQSVVPSSTNCLHCNAILEHVLVSDDSRLALASKETDTEEAITKDFWEDNDLQLDPELSHVFSIIRRQGVRKPSTSSTGEEEIAIIARFSKDPHLLGSELGIRLVSVIAPTEKDNTWLATARIPIGKIKDIRKLESTSSLKRSRRLRPCLEKTREVTFNFGPTDKVGAKNLPPGKLLGNGGEGVIVGIVDFGMDFAHKNFIDRGDANDNNFRSRIRYLWDQTSPPCDKSPSMFELKYGKEHSRDKITEALKADNPYGELGYVLPEDSLFETGAHGTYVADIAAGNGLGTSCPGVAPKADIIYVEVSTVGINQSGSALGVALPSFVGATFGDSAQILEAIQYIFEKAGDQPCVINLSLGSNNGPHDGKLLLEIAIDRLVDEAPNRMVVVAAGNSHGEDLHVVGRVPKDGYTDLKLKIPPNDSTANSLEIWYSASDRFTVEVFDPNGKSIAQVETPGKSDYYEGGDGGLLTLVSRQGDPNNGENVISAFFESGLSEGVWTMRLYGAEVQDGGFQAWIERDERGQSRFLRSDDDTYYISNECTLSSIACGNKTIVVGSYDAHLDQLPIGDKSSAGPTRDGRPKPDLCAPGENVLAAHSRTRVLRYRQSGTSLAAPVVTGVIALIMAEARAQEKDLEADDIREILIKTATKDPVTGMGWDSRLGHGRVNAPKAVAAVSSLIKK